MRYLKLFDMYGKEFSFTIFKKEKYQTYVGGILTFTLIFFFITFFVIFGQNFFYKTNPKINQQSVIVKNYVKTKIPDNSTMFTFPWMIQDYDSNPIDVSGLIYPEVTYLNYTYINKTYVPQKTVLKYSRCSSSLSYLTPQITQYYCIDTNGLNITLGGGWDGPFVQYLQIKLYTCPNRGNWDPKGNCTSLSDLDNFFSKIIYFSVLYPVLFFSGDSIDNPLQIEYKIYYYQLNIGLTKQDTFYFQKAALQDDQGWLLQQNFTNVTYHVNQRNEQYTLFPRDSYNSKTTSSLFYATSIYLGKNYDFITRSYMKFQDVVAQLGGFINILSIFSMVISSFFNQYYRDISIINKIFEYDEEKAIKNPFRKNRTLAQLLKQQAKEILQQNLDNSIEALNKASKIPDSHTNNNAKGDMNFKIGKDIQEGNNFEPGKLMSGKQSMLDRINAVIVKLEGKKSKFKPGILLAIKGICSSSNIDDHMKKKKYYTYQVCKDYLSDRLDVLFYFKSLDVLDKIKIILLNSQQNASLEYMNKLNIFDRDAVEYLKKIYSPDKNVQIKSIIDYFIDKRNNNVLSDSDHKIFDCLDFEIRNIILSATSNN